MLRFANVLLAIAATAACAACVQPAPPGVNATAWRTALIACKRVARAYGPYGNGPEFDFGAIGHPRVFVRDKSWEIVDPCMRAKGFPPPP